jgi:hypothetical protein
VQVERQSAQPRAPAPATFVAPPSAVREQSDGFDARWYLEQYERSFQGGGGEGSEYFRLAVDAYAPELLAAIAAIVRDPAAPAALRAGLAAMLGTPRFARNGLAIDALLAALRDGGEALATLALTGLAVVGDGGTAVVLERLMWSLPTVGLQQRALAAMVALYGPDSNRALQRLFAAASGAEHKSLVLAMLSTADADAALDVFRQASLDEDPVRLQAAQVVERFRGEAFSAFIEHWLGHEQDERVRQVLARARSRMSQVQPYAAQKATGAPDAEPNQDHPNAWASSRPQMGSQWLELGYRPARRASAVRIHEVNVAGEVVQVELIDEGGNRHRAWAGDDPTARPGVFEVRFATTAYLVRKVRIVLDTDRRAGWSEIDAVELLGPDGRAWAVEASASSAYGQ